MAGAETGKTRLYNYIGSMKAQDNSQPQYNRHPIPLTFFLLLLKTILQFLFVRKLPNF